MNFGDPFGLCPKAMQNDHDKCQAWNDAQIALAIAIINAERARNNQHALQVNAANVSGWNESQIAAYCAQGSQHTFTGCSSAKSGDIWVSADRDPAAIAQTIVHEQQHLNGGASEPCARRRAILYVTNSSQANHTAATTSVRPAYTTGGGSFSTCKF